MTSISEYIDATMQEQQIPGLALAVLHGDTTLYEGYHGLVNLEHTTPVTAETVWELASITKPFTAQAILLLAEEHLLELDAPLSTYLTDLPAAWQPITLRHCLAHQSGIPSYTAADAYWQRSRDDKTHAEVLDMVRDQPLNFAPGQRHSYDNTGYYLLGMVLEAVTGQSYGEVIRERICDPLGMSATRANDLRAIIPHRAAGYDLDADKTLVNRPPYSTSNTFSAGVLVSTLRDLMRWRVSLQPDGLLKPATLDTMLTPHVSAEGNELAHHFRLGLGWFLVDHDFGRFIGHNGSIVGFATSFAHFPVHDLTIISLCNQSSVPAPHALAFDVAARLVPELRSNNR